MVRRGEITDRAWQEIEPLLHRRMGMDYERLAVTSEASVYVAMNRLMVRYLAHS